MAIDPASGQRITGGPAIETTPASWPKCHQCSERLGYEYAVESYGIAERTKPMLWNGSYRLTIFGECHGERQLADIEIPAWAAKADAEGKPIQSAIEIHAIGKLRFFRRSGTGLNAKVESGLPRKIG